MTWQKYSAVVARHAGNVENQTMLFHPQKKMREQIYGMP